MSYVGYYSRNNNPEYYTDDVQINAQRGHDMQVELQVH